MLLRRFRQPLVQLVLTIQFWVSGTIGKIAESTPL